MNELVKSSHNITTTGEVETNREFVTFWIEGELFGIDILDVKEVTPLIEITPVLQAPEDVKGYVNIRGEIHLVLDLRYLLGFHPGEYSPDSRIIIFKPTIVKPFGILVDRVGDVLEVNQNKIEVDIQIEASENSLKTIPGLVTGICKLDKNLLIILNAWKLLGG